MFYIISYKQIQGDKMNFYTYLGNEDLGKEALGSENRFINKNIKNIKKTIIYKIAQNAKCFRIYSFTNFYDNNTFRLIEKRG